MDVVHTIILKESTDVVDSLIFNECEDSLSNKKVIKETSGEKNTLDSVKPRNIFIAEKIVSADAAPELPAIEPWPNDVKFFQPHDVEQILLPDNSSCLAVQAFLKMCNLNYRIEYRPNAEYMSPSGKVPFIKHGAFIVAGLDDIVKFLGERHISLTSELTQEEKADMRTYMTLINNVLLNAELYICWKDEETYNTVTKQRYGYVYPWPLNWIQTSSKRAKTLRWLKIISWGNKTIDEVYKEVENCCLALTERLDGKKYFFSNGFTELDALAYAHIYTLLTTSLPAHLGRVVEGFERLVAFCRSVDRKLFGRESDLMVKTYTQHWGVGMPIVKTVKIHEPAAKSLHVDVFAVKKIVADNQRGPEERQEDLSSEDSDDIEHLMGDIPLDLSELEPTELDALLYGHLYTIITTPLLNNDLANIFNKFPDLLTLVQRIEKKYFKRDSKHSTDL